MKKNKLLIGMLTVSLLMGATAGHAVMAENTEADSMTDTEMQELDETVTSSVGEKAAGSEQAADAEQSLGGEESPDVEQLTDKERTSEDGQPETGYQAASKDEIVQENQTPDEEQTSGQDADETVTDEENQPLSITVFPTTSDITYGQTLAESRLTGGEATVPGTFAWKTPEIFPAVADSGRTDYEVVFIPEDTTRYETVTFSLTVTVNKADAIVLVAPTPMTNAVSGSME